MSIFCGSTKLLLFLNKFVVNILKLNVVRQIRPLLMKLHKRPLNVVDCLKVMKQAASCKHRQAVKTMQCEKKYFKILIQKMAAYSESRLVRLLL